MWECSNSNWEFPKSFREFSKPNWGSSDSNWLKKDAICSEKMRCEEIWKKNSSQTAAAPNDSWMILELYPRRGWILASWRWRQVVRGQTPGRPSPWQPTDAIIPRPPSQSSLLLLAFRAPNFWSPSSHRPSSHCTVALGHPFSQDVKRSSNL